MAGFLLIVIAMYPLVKSPFAPSVRCLLHTEVGGEGLQPSGVVAGQSKLGDLVEHGGHFFDRFYNQSTQSAWCSSLLHAVKSGVLLRSSTMSFVLFNAPMPSPG
jgi:hypothetical protein